MQTNRIKQVEKARLNILVIKVISIIYLICFTCIYLTSNTGAQFTDTSIHKQLIQAGEWWDGSSLVFLNKEDQVINSCEPVELQTEVYNDSKHAMYGSTEYEVYHVSSDGVDHSLEIGDKISEGVMNIDVIRANETSMLTYTVIDPGDYFFKAYQRPSYNHNELERTSIVSEIITVTCSEVADNKDLTNEQIR